LALLFFGSTSANILGLFASFPFDTEFAMRAILDSNALNTLMLFMVIMILATSYSVHVCERPFAAGKDADGNPSGLYSFNSSYSGAIWMTLITMFTVGYGKCFCIFARFSC
jgi:hypothetical protein